MEISKQIGEINNQMDKHTSNRMIKVQNTESEPKHIKLNDKSTKHKSEKKHRIEL